LSDNIQYNNLKRKNDDINEYESCNKIRKIDTNVNYSRLDTLTLMHSFEQINNGNNIVYVFAINLPPELHYYGGGLYGLRYSN
jgi:hypothetical protein